MKNKDTIYNARLKLYTSVFSALFLICFFCAFPIMVQAETQSAEITRFTITPNAKNLTDNSDTTSTETNSITVESDKTIKSIYIIFRKKAVTFDIVSGDKTHSVNTDYLHSYTELPNSFDNCKKITVNFKEKTAISKIAVFSEGALPEWVQIWEKPYDKADLLLTSTHSDDEHLFFAGVLPYYAIERNYRVQVAYFTNHNNNNPDRNHELLNGLWAVGIDHYPVIGPFPDLYAKTDNYHNPTETEAVAKKAFNDLLKYGYTEEYIVEYQTELLRRFKPLVVIGHAFNGDYGHGQHIVNIKTLVKAIQNSNDPNFAPDSAKEYGTWTVPKLYVHNYEENKIEMNWDTPYESMGGKTPFQISQNGFDQHKSQHWTYFWNWINGTNAKPFTKASQAKDISCYAFGLYHTTVGQDVLKNDFFENLTNYDEQIRLEEERKKAEEEQARLESESIAKAESESKEAARLESERLDSLQTNTDSNNTSEQQENKNIVLVISLILIVSAVCTIAVLTLKKIKG